MIGFFKVPVNNIILYYSELFQGQKIENQSQIH